MDLVEMTPYVGFSGEGFEAHWAGFSSRCAESPWPTCSDKKYKYYFTCFLNKKATIEMNFFIVCNCHVFDIPFTMESRLVGTVRVSVNFRSSSSLVWCILRQ